MSSNFGINTIRLDSSTQVLSTDSNTILAIVGTSSILDNGLHFFGSVDSAIVGLGDISVDTGTISLALSDLKLTYVNVPLILSVVNIDEGSSIINEEINMAINNITKSKVSLGYFPDLIIAPNFSETLEVKNNLDSLAKKIKSIAICDMQGGDESELTIEVGNISSDRLILTYPDVKTINGNNRPMSTFIASMIAQTDSAWDYGYSDSFSNRVIPGISGLAKDIEFIEGQSCEADRLRSLGITVAIYNKGLRSWGGETTSLESAWKSLHTVRIFDKVMEAAQNGLDYAIDRNALQVLPTIKSSVNSLLNGLQGNGVILGFKLSFPEDLNTEENLKAGEFSMIAEFTETPLVKKLAVTFSKVGTYYDELLTEI